MLANNYIKTWQTTKDILNDLLNDVQKDKVLFSNANNFYKLGLS